MRAATADNARIFQALADEKEVTTLIELVIDQTLPRDIRRKASDRLNDLEKATLVYLRTCANQDILGKVSRCGHVQAKFQAFAKGALKSPSIENGDSVATLRLIALLEAQNALLRQLPRKLEVSNVPF